VVEKILRSLQKTVPLYGYPDRGITKYGCSLNIKSHGKIINP
jgi:hypothetical protein